MSQLQPINLTSSIERHDQLPADQRNSVDRRRMSLEPATAIRSRKPRPAPLKFVRDNFFPRTDSPMLPNSPPIPSHKIFNGFSRVDPPTPPRGPPSSPRRRDSDMINSLSRSDPPTPPRGPPPSPRRRAGEAERFNSLSRSDPPTPPKGPPPSPRRRDVFNGLSRRDPPSPPSGPPPSPHRRGQLDYCFNGLSRRDPPSPPSGPPPSPRRRLLFGTSAQDAKALRGVGAEHERGSDEAAETTIVGSRGYPLLEDHEFWFPRSLALGVPLSPLEDCPSSPALPDLSRGSSPTPSPLASPALIADKRGKRSWDPTNEFETADDLGKSRPAKKAARWDYSPTFFNTKLQNDWIDNMDREHKQPAFLYIETYIEIPTHHMAKVL